MTRPRSWKVPVGLTEYTVREQAVVKDEKGEELQGYCQFDKKRISISTGGAESAQVLAFWHEYLHAVTHELGYEEQCDSENFVESVSSSIARAVFAVPKRFKTKP